MRPDLLRAPEDSPRTLGSTAGASTDGVPANAVLSGPATGTLSGAATPIVALTAPGAASDATRAGQWLSADGWCTDTGDAANEQPLIGASEGPEPGVRSAAARRAARILIWQAERKAETLAAATATSTSTPTHAAAGAAARTRAAGPPVAVVPESVSHGHNSGMDAAGDGASRPAAYSAPRWWICRPGRLDRAFGVSRLTGQHPRILKRLVFGGCAQELRRL